MSKAVRVSLSIGPQAVYAKSRGRREVDRRPRQPRRRYLTEYPSTTQPGPVQVWPLPQPTPQGAKVPSR